MTRTKILARKEYIKPENEIIVDTKIQIILIKALKNIFFGSVIQKKFQEFLLKKYLPILNKLYR